MENKNILENRAEKLPFRPVDITHSKHHQHFNVLRGIWWYNVKSGQLVLSRTAKSHLDPEFVGKIPGITLSDKIGAEKLGWISGRLGVHNQSWFAFLYEKPLKSLPHDVALGLLKALEFEVKSFIRYFTDSDGSILIENKKGETK